MTVYIKRNANEGNKTLLALALGTDVSIIRYQLINRDLKLQSRVTIWSIVYKHFNTLKMRNIHVAAACETLRGLCTIPQKNDK